MRLNRTVTSRPGQASWGGGGGRGRGPMSLEQGKKICVSTSGFESLVR